MKIEELYNTIEASIFKQLRGDWLIHNRSDSKFKSMDYIEQFKKEAEKNKCEQCKYNFENKDKLTPLDKYYSTEY